MKKLLPPFDGSESALIAAHHAAAEATSGPETEIHLLHVIEHCLSGTPAQQIAAYARLAGCDAIVMDTHGRSAGASFLIGSVATQVVRLVDIPVTLVK